jgi:hypothetical protein
VRKNAEGKEEVKYGGMEKSNTGEWRGSAALFLNKYKIFLKKSADGIGI